ncbi:hypothetical protein [Lacrimispora celerecrescens]|uniref:hypothetical protein n=1 Tax=Lacrimispora celerecrescens TaxID=29354 RepID=UPI00140978DA|nr:hypothetical protein [Lacrimispora celerecrescens]
MTAEEVVTLEKEGRAALREMDEALPDLVDNVVPFTAAEKLGSDKADKPEMAAPAPETEKPKEPEKPQEAAKPHRGRPSLPPAFTI